MPVRGFDPKIQYLKIQNKNLNRTILNQLIIERSGGRKMISLHCLSSHLIPRGNEFQYLSLGRKM
jgi:hypothetical protein